MAKPANKARKSHVCVTSGAHADMVRRCILQVGRQFGDGERHPRPVADIPVVPKDDRQQAQKRQHAAGQCEEEELDRRVAPLVASPDADEEEERHERELEEKVKENDVAGDEHSQHARAQQKQKAVIEPLLVLDGVPAYQHGDDEEQGRKDEEPQAQAIEADGELDVQRSAERLEPMPLRLRVDKLGLAKRELDGQHDRADERRERANASRPAAGLQVPPRAGHHAGGRGQEYGDEQEYLRDYAYS